jgi:hypothetical protein
VGFDRSYRPHTLRLFRDTEGLAWRSIFGAAGRVSARNIVFASAETARIKVSDK